MLGSGAVPESGAVPVPVLEPEWCPLAVLEAERCRYRCRCRNRSGAGAEAVPEPERCCRRTRRGAGAGAGSSPPQPGAEQSPLGAVPGCCGPGISPFTPPGSSSSSRGRCPAVGAAPRCRCSAESRCPVQGRSGEGGDGCVVPTRGQPREFQPPSLQRGSVFSGSLTFPASYLLLPYI